jgi:hypothetical protein
MFPSVTVTLLALAMFFLVRADPTPTQPGPGDSFKAGGPCHIEWDVDTTGLWKIMNIELMTGSNTGMVHLTTVTTADGTDPTKNTFDYPCPAVKPNSAIYFYQFTTPANSTKYWTTRFTLADAQGGSTPPTNPTQPETNEPIPWGTGALVNPADAKPPPPGGGDSSGAANSSVAASAPPVTPSLPSSTVLPPSTSFSTVVAKATEASTSSATPSATGAAGNVQGNGAAGLTLDARIYFACVFLVAAYGGLL